MSRRFLPSQPRPALSSAARLREHECFAPGDLVSSRGFGQTAWLLEREDERREQNSDNKEDQIERDPEPQVIREFVASRAVNHEVGLVAKRRRKAS